MMTAYHSPRKFLFFLVFNVVSVFMLYDISNALAYDIRNVFSYDIHIRNVFSYDRSNM